jgi:hypothetical protein
VHAMTPTKALQLKGDLTPIVARCYRTLSVSSGPAVMNQRLK